MCTFFIQNQISKLFFKYVQLCDFWRQNFVRKTLMKLTAGPFKCESYFFQSVTTTTHNRKVVSSIPRRQYDRWELCQSYAGQIDSPSLDPPIVNFNNILQEALVPILLHHKITKPNCNQRKSEKALSCKKGNHKINVDEIDNWIHQMIVKQKSCVGK